MEHTYKKYMQIHKNQSVEINLIKVSICDLINSSIVTFRILIIRAKLNSEIIICRSLSNREGRIIFLAHTSGKMSIS